MSKRKIFLASIITASAMTLIGCSGGGGTSSVVEGVSGDSFANGVKTLASNEYSSSTNLTIDGEPFYAARSSATGSTPPSAPKLVR